MAEVYIPYSLVTPAGTLAFNPVNSADGLYLSDVAGLDGPDLRATVDNRPTADGGIMYDGWQGAYYPILTGYIRQLADGTFTARRQAEDAMRAMCRSIRRADGTLQWTPSGGTARQLTVRLFQPLSIQSQAGPIKTFQITLASAASYVTDVAQNSQNTANLATASGSFVIPFTFPVSFGSSATGLASLTVGGDIETYPVVRIFGQCASPKIVNFTTGQSVSLPGLSIGTGQFVDVDMLNQTVKLNGVTSVISNLDVVNSTFWSLPVGANSVKLIASGFDSNAKATITWANAWQ